MTRMNVSGGGVRVAGRHQQEVSCMSSSVVACGTSLVGVFPRLHPPIEDPIPRLPKKRKYSRHSRSCAADSSFAFIRGPESQSGWPFPDLAAGGYVVPISDDLSGLGCLCPTDIPSSSSA